jgi:hypothetical protein
MEYKYNQEQNKRRVSRDKIVPFKDIFNIMVGIGVILTIILIVGISRIVG